MLLIVLQLNVPPPIGLINSPLHRTGDRIGIENRPAAEIAGGAADGLNERAFRAQKAFLVRIKHRHQCHLWQVQAFPQQIDAHQHIKHTEAQVTDDF